MDEEIEEESRGVSTWIFVVSCVYAMLGLIPSFLFLIFNLRYRSVRLIKMSSPNLNAVISIGGTLVYLSLILWGLGAFTHDWDSLATVICRLRAWMLPITFTLIFGSLLVKSWRVRRIFESPPATRVIIKDKKLFSMLAGFLFIDIIVLTIWQLVDPLQSYYTTQTNIQHSRDDTQKVTSTVTSRTCSSDYSSIWLTALYIYKTFLLLYAAYLSWAIRAVTIPSMNDSVAVILSCIITTFAGSATTAIYVVFSHWPDVTSLVIMTTLWLCTTFTLCVVYIPKITMWWRKTDEEMMKIQVAPQIISSPNQSIDQVEHEIFHLVAENKSLKKSLSEKEDAIHELQETVSNAKDKLNLLLQKEDCRHDSGLDVDLSTSDLHISGEEVHRPNGEAMLEQKSFLHTNKSAIYRVDPEGQTTSRSSTRSMRSIHSLLSKFHLFKQQKLGKTSFTNTSKSKSHGQENANIKQHSNLSSSSGSQHPHGYTPSNGEQTEDYLSGDSQYLGYPNYSPYLSSRIRDSIGDIALHMDMVDHLTTRLRDSIAIDMNRYHRRHGVRSHDISLPYASNYSVSTRAPDIVGSIVDSYDMERDSDTMSYVSNHLSNQPSHHSNRNSVAHTQALSVNIPGSHDSFQLHDRETYCSSLPSMWSHDNAFALGNDKYYPGIEQHLGKQYQRYLNRVHRRGKKRQGKGRSKTQRPKVFTLDPGQEPIAVAASGIAVTQGLPSLISFV